MFRYLGLVLFFIITVFGAGVSESLAAGEIRITSCSATVDLEYFSSNITSGNCSINPDSVSPVVFPPSPGRNTSGDTTDFTLTPGTYTYTMNCNGGSDTATFVVEPPAGGCGGGAGTYDISAAPTSVNICSPETTGSSNITWTAPAGVTVDVYIEATGQLFASSVGSGSAVATWIVSGQTYNFVLKTRTDGLGKDSVSVTGTSNNCSAPATGQCGTAARQFLSTETSYGTYTQCSLGSPSTTAFPPIGGQVDWLCAYNGNNSQTCTATRDFPVNPDDIGICGDANGYNFRYSDTTYYNMSRKYQCTAGTPSTTNFPLPGSFRTWICNSPAGSSPTCRATRDPDPATMSATITANPNPCEIPIGGTGCTSAVTWTTRGTVAETDGVWRYQTSVPHNVLFSPDSNGSGVTSPIVKPNNEVILRVRNASTSNVMLAETIITAVCASGSTWNGSSCVATTPLVNGMCGGAKGHAFASSDTAYTPVYNQCTAGSPSSTAFPAQGGSVTWVCNGSGGGSNSEDCNATRAFSASANGSCNKVDVTWDVASGATNYTLYRTLDVAAKAPSWTNLGIFTGNVYTDAAVTNGLTYYYRVTANTGASTNHTYPAAIPVSCTIPPIPTISNSASGITLGQSISYNIAATDGDSNMTDLNFDYKGPSGVWNWNGGGQGSTNPSDVSNNFTPRASYGSLTYSLTPNTAGTYTVAAAAKDVDNPYQYAYRTLTVCPVTSPWDGSTCNSSSGTGERLIVCPVDPVNVLVGNTTQLQAKYWANAGTVTCSTSGSTDVTNSSTWSGDNNTIGTVSNSVGTKGLATGVVLGTFEASATYSGLTARKDVNVTDGSGGPYTPPPDIDIVADPRIIRSGDTADVTVTVTAAYSLSCELFGAATGTFSHTTGTTEFDVVSSVLTSARIVRVICTDPDGKSTRKDARIEVIPTFQEI